jgi:Arc/MetJ-type ribon-helix-helix transcriptional regulator
MVRTQITLTEEQHRRLARVARARGVSMSELVRQAVDATVADADEQTRRNWERAKAVIGAFDSGIPDIAESHDDYLPDRW